MFFLFFFIEFPIKSINPQRSKMPTVKSMGFPQEDEAAPPLVRAPRRHSTASRMKAMPDSSSKVWDTSGEGIRLKLDETSMSNMSR